MKRLTTLLCVLLCTLTSTYAQLTGTKTIPGDYATVVAAVTDLNAQGVGSGGVTFNIAAGYTETLSGTIVLTATGTSANPIIFQKSGAGANPVITAHVGTSTPGSATPDGIWALVGSDYVTIDGINLTDPNAANPATMEYGFGLFKAGVTNGAQYNTIKNCTITMNRANFASGTSPMVEGAVGILIINSVNTAATTALTPTSAAGSNSYNKIYSNTINSGNYGIVIAGYSAASPFTLGDSFNDIGGSSSATGNTILNFGGGTGSTNPSAGIRTSNQWDLNISYNNIDNNNGGGVNHPYTLRGIYAQSGTSANININNNTVSIKGGGTTTQISCIENATGSTAASNTVNINNNIVQNCTYSTGTTGSFYGIYNTATPATANINNNVIQNITYTGAITTGTLYCLVNATTAVVSINGNKIKDITLGGTSSPSYCIGVGSPTGAGCTASGNKISNITRTGASGTQRGIIMTNPTNNMVFNADTIEGISWTNTTSIGSIDGLYGLSSATNITISNCIIRNLSTPTTGTIQGIRENGISGTKLYQNNRIYNFYTTAGGAGGATFYGIYVSTGNIEISGNQIYQLTSTGTTGGTGGSIYGIYLSGGTTNAIFKNQVYNLSSTSTNPAIAGIYLTGGTTNSVYNNFISDLLAPASTAATSLSGIYISSGTTNNIFYNTIYLNATGGATFGSSGIYKSSTTNADLRNNIVVNASTPGSTSGYTVAFRWTGAYNATYYAATSNNNCFYAGTPGANRLIFYDGTNSDQTITAYKTRVTGRDAMSISELPPFVNIGSAPFNLHLQTTVATQCESGGIRVTTPIAVTDDWDGNTRFGETGYAGTGSSTDIGADEGNFTVLDLIPPVISYTALLNQASLTTVPFSGVNITDLSLVNVTAGTKPRVYFKTSTNANSLPATNDNTTDGWKYVEANGSSSPFDFTIDQNLLFGGVSAGSIIQYFVVAQDMATTPNVGINSGTFSASPSSVALTAAAFPIGGTINQYQIVPSICGTFMVGASQIAPNYTTLTAAFTDLNSKAITCPVVLELQSDYASASETYPLILNANGGSSAVNTITIKPAAGVNATISGSSATSILKLYGVDYVIIDGSNNGTSSKDLTITNTNAGTSSAVVWIGSASASDGATNNTVKNCNINGSGTAQTLDGIFVGSGATIGNIAEAANNNNTLLNNTIKSAQNGIYGYGIASMDQNLNVSSNSIGSTVAAEKIQYKAVYLQNQQNLSVLNNTISGVLYSGTTPTYGIHLAGVINTASVSGNRISDVKNTNSSGYSAIGIALASSSNTSAITVSNNVIYDIAGYGFSSLTTDNGYGINLLSGGGYNIYYNSINLATNQTLTTGVPAAIIINSALVTAGSVNIKNNIFAIPATIGTDRYAILCNAAASIFGIINFNDYYTSGSNLAYAGSSNKANFAALQGWTTQDANSLSANPKYTSTTNLQLDLSSPALNTGNPVSGITVDILGTTRNATNPSMGAFETGVDLSGPSISYTPLNNTTSLTNRTLAATITDPSNVNTTSGTKPRIYFKKATNANVLPATNDNTTDGWKWTEATNASSPFNLDIDYSIINGGVAAGDSIYYFVVAQDLIGTPNVSINLGGFASTPASVALSSAAFPIAKPINSYRVAYSLNGNITIGTSGTYPTLTGAGGLFNIINDNYVTGDITATIISDLTEPGTYALNEFSKLGSGSHKLTIVSDGTVERLVSGSVANAMIRFNGADSVTINGLAGKLLRFRNTNASYATLLYQNDAIANTLTNCFIEGSNTTSTSGVIVYSTSTGTTGNDYNTISNCVVRDRSDAAGVPANLITSYGSAGAVNDNISITGNTLFNFTASAISGQSTGMGNNWTINNNSVYQTATRSTAINAISIAAGDGHVISTNSIGGSAFNRSGAAFTTSSSFSGITLAVGTTTPASVQGNTISNIASSATSVGVSGITVSSGSVNIGTITGNILGGGMAAYDTILNTYDAALINVSSSTVINIENNTLSNYRYKRGSNDRTAGIYVNGGVANIRNNIIHDISSNSTGTGTSSFIPVGIVLTSSTSGNNIESNHIYNIINTNTGTTAYVCNGIYINGAVTNTTIKNNEIYNLNAAGTGTGSSAPDISGIYLNSGTCTVFNNTISLGTGVTASDARIYGIRMSSATSCDFYYNSVNITGSSTGSANTYAFDRSVSSTVNIKNNVFVNTRTGGTGKHYAISNSYSTPASGWLAANVNYNDLLGTANLGLWNATPVTTFATWKTTSSADANSLNVDPLFTSASNLLPGNCSPILRKGTDIPAITSSINSVARTNPPDMGAYQLLYQPMNIAVTPTQITCNGNSDGILVITVTGGTAPLQYSIDNGATWQASNTFSGLALGNYNIQVKDANPCTLVYASNPVAITQPSAITISNAAATNNTCNGGTSGNITITAAGGTGALEYSIDNGTTWQASNVFNGLIAGNYTVKVKDANNCTSVYASNPVVLTDPAAIVISNISQTDVSCFGGSDATLTITATGGTGTLYYSLDNGTTWSTSSSYTGMAATLCYLKVKDDNNCEVTYALNPIAISQPGKITIASVTPTNLLCNGVSTGEISIVATDGTGTLQYSIDNGTTWSTSGTFSSLPAGNYNISVKDANACQVFWASNPLVLTQPNAINISSVVKTDVTSCSLSDGTITITATDGTGTLEYSIDNGASWQTSGIYTALTAGNYNVKVKDANGCIVTYASNPVMIVTPASVLIDNVTSTNLTCHNSANGTITITASAGTPPYTYSIDGGTTYASNGGVFTGLAAGTYNIAVKDVIGCITAYASNPVTLTQPDAISITFSSSNVSCNGGSNGSATAIVTGGTGAYNYAWTPSGGGAATASGLTAGNYTVTIMDANSCTASNSITISQPSAINISAVTPTAVSCFGGANGQVTITATGGTGTLQYSINGGTSWQTGNTFTGLSAGNCTIEVKDANNCTLTYASNPVAINEPASAVAISNVAVTNVACFGASTGSITITAAGGTGALQYSINNGTSWQTGNTFNGLAASTYTILVKDANNCQVAYASNPVTISQPTSAVAISNVVSTNINCNGANNGSITITATGGTGTLQYSIDNGSTYQTSNSFTSLSNGNYNIKVEDANLCTATYASNPVVISQPSAVNISNVATTNILCYGASTGSIVVTAAGGTGSLQYSIDNGSTFQASNTFATLSSNTYNVVVKDANNCQLVYAGNPVSLTQPASAVSITSVTPTDAVCNGSSTGSIVIAAGGGTGTLQYSINNGSSWQTGNTFSSIAAGNYTLVVKDANNCQIAYASNPVAIAQPSAIVISSVIKTKPVCNGNADATITVTAAGGTGTLEYSIDNGATWTVSNTFTGLIAGSYNVKVKDANSCIVTYASNPVVITQPAAIAISSVTPVNVLCYGNSTGTITISANGGATALLYSINNGTSFQTSNVFSGLVAGNYNVVVKDSNNCSLNYASNPVNIAQPASAVAITNVTSSNVNCNGGNDGSIVITANGGTGALQYSINNGTTWQATAAFTTVTSGSYTVVVKDANGCQTAWTSNPIVISQPAALAITSVTSTNVLCNGGSDGTITITATGGTSAYQYSVDNGSNYQASNIFTGLTSASYTIKIKDAHNCTAVYTSNPVVITEPATAVSITSVTSSDLTCNNGANGSVTITATGGTGALEYSADNGVTWSTSATINGLGAGNHNIRVRDANLCTAVYSGNPVVLNEPNPIIITGTNTTNILCHGGTDGAIDVYGVGGTGALQYSIDSGATWQSSWAFTGLTAGNYNVMVQDANNCVQAYSSNPVVVTEPAAISITSINITHNLCNGGNNAALEILVSGGTGAMEYSINNGLSWTSANNFTNLTAGSFTVLVRDENYCTVVYSGNPVVIADPAAVTISSIDSTDVTTYGGSDGSITVHASGGTGILQYSDNGGATWQISNVFSGLTAGGYIIQVKDENGCTTSYVHNPVVISQPSGIEESSATTVDFKVYPDPTEGEFTIEALNLSDLVKIEIATIEGKIVDVITAETFKQNNMKMKYEFASDVRGMYFIRLLTSDKVYIRKIVVN
jgi:hypothetical protein